MPRASRSLWRPAVTGLLSLTLFAWAAGPGAAPAHANQATAGTDQIIATIDQSSLVRLPRQGTDVIIGNPSIADFAVQNGKLLVVTGKSFGVTNVIVLDAEGDEIINQKVTVRADRKHIVTLHKGAFRRSYHCGHTCQVTLLPGDTSGYFEAVSKEIQEKFGVAQSALDGAEAQR